MNDAKDMIYAELLARIESGTYPAGGKLPTERELAAAFDATLWSVHSAMNVLEENGLVERRRALGTFVATGIASRKIRRHRNLLSKTIMCVASRDFYYSQSGYEDIIGDTERALRAKGWNLVYEDMPPTGEPLRRFLDKCDEAGIKALIVFPEYKEWKTLYFNTSAFLKYPGNIYYFNRGLGHDAELPFNSISLDMRQSGIAAGEWALEKGGAPTAFISIAFDFHWLQQRREGVKLAFAAVDKPLHMILRENLETLFAPAEEFIRSASAPPTIICSNDTIAASVHEHLRTNKLESGRDYFLVGFDNNPRHRSLKMTSVDWPLEQVGELFAQMLEASEAPGHHELYATKLLLRPRVIERTAAF